MRAKVTTSAVNTVEKYLLGSIDNFQAALEMNGPKERRRAIICEVLESVALAVSDKNLTFFEDRLFEDETRAAVR